MTSKRLELRAGLAELAHERWAGWMKWMLSKGVLQPSGAVTLPADWVARWRRQMATPYGLLPWAEQQGDLREADRVLEIVTELLPAEGES